MVAPSMLKLAFIKRKYERQLNMEARGFITGINMMEKHMREKDMYQKIITLESVLGIVF